MCSFFLVILLFYMLLKTNEYFYRWSFNSNEYLYAFFEASQCFYMYFETKECFLYYRANECFICSLEILNV
jgi:hypothetical protein